MSDSYGLDRPYSADTGSDSGRAGGAVPGDTSRPFDFDEPGAFGEPEPTSPTADRALARPVETFGGGGGVALRPGAQFRFDGGAGSFFLVGLGSTLLCIFTLGLGTPWAVAMSYRWQTQHTIINGRRLRFTGSGGSLFGHWIKWWFLCVITIGIYNFWVVPRMIRWGVEHQDFA